jgi:hypothetical protein
MSELIKRDEVASALEARRELGPEYEDEVVDALVEKIEKRLPQQRSAARRGAITPLALGSIFMGIPLTAIASSNSGLAAVVVVWVGIVLVNVAAAAYGGRR